MPIIKVKEKKEKEQIRINIDQTVVERVRQYCEWAGVKKIDDFFEQAAKYLLAKDKDWKVHLNQAEKV